MADQPTIFNSRAFRVRLAELGMNLSDLAEAAGLSSSYTAQIGRGLIPPEDVRARVAAALRCEPSTLWIQLETAALSLWPR